AARAPPAAAGGGGAGAGAPAGARGGDNPLRPPAPGGGPAARPRHSTWLEVLTRTGLIGYGILHLAVAWLAIQIATGKPATTADQAGAFRLVDQQPAGEFILVVIAAGLAAMAVWQLLLAMTGHREYTGRRRVLE